mmetsp:Transcript_21917/g.47404  ORF Transcript_21917/g.47404 Transcript_21917/m.47404 type:complete len:136 (-) Transcript_21917:126-533(-)
MSPTATDSAYFPSSSSLSLLLSSSSSPSLPQLASISSASTPSCRCSSSLLLNAVVISTEESTIISTKAPTVGELLIVDTLKSGTNAGPAKAALTLAAGTVALRLLVLAFALAALGYCFHLQVQMMSQVLLLVVLC